MKALSDAIAGFFDDNIAQLPWLAHVMGIGFREPGQNDAFGYMAGTFGLQLTNTTIPPALPVWQRQDGPFQFGIGDTDQTAVYVCHEGEIQYGGDTFTLASEVSAPISIFITCPIEKVDAYGPALAFLLTKWDHSTGVSLKLSRSEALLDATNKKSTNTNLGVAKISMTVKLIIGADCTVIPPCD